MSEVIRHPRIAVGAIKNRKRQLEAERDRAVSALETALEGLKTLARQRPTPWVKTLVRAYETTLYRLKALDPANPPSVEYVRAVGARLEQASARLTREFGPTSRPPAARPP